MLWGEPWGGEFGAGAPALEDTAALALSRFPSCTREGQPTMMAFAAVIADRWQGLENFIASLQPSFLLDIQAVWGVWLDRIGANLGVPRDGREDEYYRRVLAAYAAIVLPKRRTIPGLIEALEQFAGAGQVSYQPAYPMAFTVNVAGTTIGSREASDIRAILKLATPASYQAGLVEAVPNPFLWSDQSGTITVTSEFWSDASDPEVVSTGANWSSLTVID